MLALCERWTLGGDGVLILYQTRKFMFLLIKSKNTEPLFAQLSQIINYFEANSSQMLW